MAEPQDILSGLSASADAANIAKKLQESKYKHIRSVLKKHSSKDFVKRILEPEKYPSLDMGNGWKASHLMAWGEDGPEDSRRYYVYPTVINNGSSLRQLSGEDAVKHAKRTGEYIEFDTPTEADWFSKHYKDIWEE